MRNKVRLCTETTLHKRSGIRRLNAKLLKVFGALLLVCLAFATDAFATVTIAQNGSSKYRIVVPTRATAAEKYAAEELQHYLEKLTAAKLPVVTDNEPAAPLEILLGDNAHLGKAREKVDFAKLGPDGFVLRSDARRLIIAGGRPRGTLNGVYALLEEKLGVRWFTPELEVVPRMDRLRLAELNERVVPALENRDVYWREMMRNADFAARSISSGCMEPRSKKSTISRRSFRSLSCDGVSLAGAGAPGAGFRLPNPFLAAMGNRDTSLSLGSQKRPFPCISRVATSAFQCVTEPQPVHVCRLTPAMPNAGGMSIAADLPSGRKPLPSRNNSASNLPGPHPLSTFTTVA